MAVTAKTSQIPLHINISSSITSTFYQSQAIKFSKIIQTQNLSLKKTHEVYVLSATSSDTTDPNLHICELCLHGRLEQAMKHLESVQELQISLEEDTYVALLQLCELKRAADEGNRLYNYISKSFSRFGVKLGNALLDMFVRLRNLRDAWYVFGKMPERNVFTWNVLLGGYAKGGFFEEALNLYHKMIWVGITPDIYTFPSVLKSCGGLRDLTRGREVHAHVLTFGYGSDVDVVNALISFYVKCGDLVSARVMFDKMPVRDRVSWNAMIAGNFENARYIRGLELFVTMRECDMDPNLLTMTSVLSACEAIGDGRLGIAVHGYAAKTEFSDEVPLDNCLIQMYSSVGYWGEAEKVFARLEFKDVVSWTAMISGYESNGFPDKAIQTYKMMELDGVMPDEITIASVLSACASLGLLDYGIQLHELAKMRGFISYVIVANALIDFYSKCGCIDKAIEVFHQIPVKNVFSWTSMILGLRINNRCFEALIHFRQMKLSVNPNSITYISVLPACARLGSLKSGKEIHAHALRNRVAFDGFVPNAIIDMYMRCGRMKYALNQFRIQRKDITSWNILLTGYAERGHGELAAKLFDKMSETGVKPNEITFTALIRACSRSGMVTKGLEYFDSMMRNYHVAPNLKHYACVVDLLGRAGQLENAYKFILKMPIEPNAAVWGALLHSCRIHKQVQLGEVAAQRIFEKDDEDTDKYYDMLCNLYADSGKWDEVSRVRKTMQEKGLAVDPGCSWVEIKGKVNAFLSGDDSHPRIEEINAVLEGLYEKMRKAGVDSSAVGSLSAEEEDSRAEILCGHSERLAIAFGLINTVPGTPISVTKNLYMCNGCHNAVKFISNVVRREISVRDADHFHCFKDGVCSCGDRGYQRND